MTSATLIGRRLGSYEIRSLLGTGGMGEVYRAQDSKLGRDVALKFLPTQFTSDPDRLARFEREARALAALSHQHVAGIYGIEDLDDAGTSRRTLVLELVEGETLADRLTRGAVPLAEALNVASQIANALEAAHERGLIHRDLKPANIKITPGGVVKVLDFGLAKAIGVAGGHDFTQSPAVTVDETRDGVILGTFAYMSPEQARGKPVDKRTDIWAFGCVLYEMLAGRKAFERETVSDTMAAVLEHDPPWQRLPAAMPPNVRRVLQRCLEKDVHKRLRDAGDARIELDEALRGGTPGAVARRAPVLSRAVPWFAAVIIVTVLAAAFYMPRFRTPDGGSGPPAPPRMKFGQMTSQSGVEWFPSLSPDGKWVVYAGEGTGNRDIYLQSVTGQTPINLTPDSMDEDDQPAFSRDGERIAFRSGRDGGGIFVMGRTGESVRRVTRQGFKPAWSPDGSELAFTTQNVELTPQNTQGQSELWVVNVNSGVQRHLNVGDAVLANWSPHGRRIAYTKRLGDGRQRDIWTSPSGTGESTPVTNDAANDWGAVWAPDGQHLYFTSDRAGSMNLWRVAIDEETGKTLGQPEPITTPAPFVAHPTISGDGSRIAYSSVLQSRNIQKLALEPATGVPKGEPTWLTTGSRSWANPDPSPDGQWIAFYSSAPEEHLFVVRNDGTGLRQVTNDAAVTERVPRWSPDGKWIAYFSNRRSATFQASKIRPDGSDLQLLTEASDDVRYPIWAPDGARMAITVIGKTPDAGHVYIFDPSQPWMQQNPQLLPPLQNPRLLFLVNSWSRDGERLVGQAGLASQGVVTYSLRSGTFDRLTDFGEFPVWLPDSQRVLFVSGGKDFFVVDTRSRNVQKVFSVNRDVIGPAQLSRDGRGAYFSRRTTEADIWLLTLDAAGKAER
jgi:Tol biopolymer transport system component